MFSGFKQRLRDFIRGAMKDAYLDALAEQENQRQKDEERRAPLRKKEEAARQKAEDAQRREEKKQQLLTIRKGFYEALHYDHSPLYSSYFHYRLKAAEEAALFLKEHAKDAIVYKDTLKCEVLRHGFGLITVDGLMIECGVYKGRSINVTAKHFPNKTIYGFDSFEGLPEDWSGFQDAKGTFATPLPAVEPNVQLIKGWFDDTLPAFHQEQPEGPIGLLHVDCDLYSSATTVFETLGSRIVPGTVIVFDEYYNYPNWQEHEAKAFAEFCEKNQVTYTFKAFGFYQASVIIDSIRGEHRQEA